MPIELVQIHRSQMTINLPLFQSKWRMRSKCFGLFEPHWNRPIRNMVCEDIVSISSQLLSASVKRFRNYLTECLSYFKCKVIMRRMSCLHVQNIIIIKCQIKPEKHASFKMRQNVPSHWCVLSCFSRDFCALGREMLIINSNKNL